jgi:hypothetical protein
MRGTAGRGGGSRDLPGRAARPSIVAMTRAAFLTLALLLAACNKGEEGTSVSLQADNGAVSGALDGKTGQLKIDVPGFEGSIRLPKLNIDATNVDLNGVKLYPGSKVSNVELGDAAGGGMKLSFESPASAATVRSWLGERLGKAGFQLKADGEALTGTTDEHKPFRLEMRPDGEGRSQGTITIG